MTTSNAMFLQIRVYRAFSLKPAVLGLEGTPRQIESPGLRWRATLARGLFGQC